MKAIVATEPSQTTGELKIEFMDRETPALAADQCLVEIRGASVNASDTKGLMGTMPRLAWPRVPGRDYAGRVVEGPAGTVGREVWGSGADLGMSRDGAHAEYMVADTASLHDKPANISMLEAAGIGVPFCTAWIGLVEYADVQAGETVAVFGLNGKVGQAVTQIATMKGARVIGIERRRADYRGHANGPVEVVDASRENVLESLKERVGGDGPEVAFNTVGEPYFQIANSALARRGRHVIINALEKTTAIDLSEFYRRRLQLLGMASMGFDATAIGKRLEAMHPHFESGALRPFPIDPQTLFSLDRAGEAYRLMLADKTRSRVLIDPSQST